MSTKQIFLKKYCGLIRKSDTQRNYGYDKNAEFDFVSDLYIYIYINYDCNYVLK